MKGILLDTHVWLYIANDEFECSEVLRKEINKASQEGLLFISAITLWEVSMLAAKGRITKLVPNCLHGINEAIRLTGVEVLELTSEVAVDSCYLPGNFHPDPSDRMIVATARIHDLCLITADKAILKYGSEKYVKTLAA
jgi:PIN domain nuclease of toxin-antitoxin system